MSNIEYSKDMIILHEKIRNYIKNCDAMNENSAAEGFNALCLEIFSMQYERIHAYKKYCGSKGVKPGLISSYLEIPPVPVSAFKAGDIFIYPKEAARLTFKTSGTSATGVGHSYFSPACAEITSLAIVENAKKYLFPDGVNTRFFLVAPPPEAAPHLTMVFGITEVMKNIGPYGGKHYIGKNGVEFDALFSDLSKCRDEGVPATIIAPSFAMVAIMDKMKNAGLTFKMPEGSRTLDAGGFKGKSREVSRDEMVKSIGEAFGVRPEYCVNTLGMSEIATQYYDNTLKNHIEGKISPIAKENPRWARTLIADMETGKIFPRDNGEKTGVLVHLDLCDFERSISILTDDLGRYRGECGFEILGRAKGAEARGCSLAIEEFISGPRN